MRVLLLSLLVFSLVTPFAQAARWETFTDCRLREDRYYDGDSFHFRVGKEDLVFRLYFVDAPETESTYPSRVRSQGRHFGLAPEQTLALGESAKRFAGRFLKGRAVTVKTCREDARGAGGQPRFYAIVETSSGNLAEELVRNGLARVYGKPTPERWPGGADPKAFFASLDRASAKAKRDGLGGWKREDSPATTDASTREPEPSSADFEGRINLNTATAAELETLPRIGPSLAAKIIDGRPWKRAEDLESISGISAKMAAALAELAYAAPVKPLPHTGTRPNPNGAALTP